MCTTDARLWMLHRYETDYGIFNHDIPASPEDGMALVRMHPMEDTFKFSSMYDVIIKYDELNVNSRFGLSLTEFLELPREIATFVLERCLKPRASEQPIIDSLNKPI